MSSRIAEKQRRRAERERLEAELAAAERRRSRRRIATSVAVGAVAVAGILGVASIDGPTDQAIADSETSFGQHYEGLEERRTKAKVSTMGNPSAHEHTHQQLTVLIDGRPIEVPANIGIHPHRPGSDMAGLHTHDPTGKIHNEGQADATLGQFFAVWGVPFTKDQLGPYAAGKGRVVQMWVDGKPSEKFGDLRLKEGQNIVVSLGSRTDKPPVG